MSYCRKSVDSDVYVVRTRDNRASARDGWECLSCDLRPIKVTSDFRVRGSAFFETRREMVEHLLTHRSEGQQVPEHALERLYQEIKENL